MYVSCSIGKATIFSPSNSFFRLLNSLSDSSESVFLGKALNLYIDLKDCQLDRCAFNPFSTTLVKSLEDPILSKLVCGRTDVHLSGTSCIPYETFTYFQVY
ncbi:hypothetical protein ACTFIW_003334 [Dictyostelium discoideum]